MNWEQLSSLGVLVGIAAVLYLAWTLWRKGKKPESLGEWALQAEAAARWGQMAVTASEQLWESDQISKEDRFHHADKFLEETLPNLTEHQRTMLIEGAVGGLHEARARGWLPGSGALGITPSGHPQSGAGEI